MSPQQHIHAVDLNLNLGGRDGYLGRADDPPLGTTVICLGFSRIADLVEGARIAKPSHNVACFTEKRPPKMTNLMDQSFR